MSPPSSLTDPDVTMSKEIKLKDYRHLMASLFEMKDVASANEPRTRPRRGLSGLVAALHIEVNQCVGNCFD